MGCPRILLTLAVLTLAYFGARPAHAQRGGVILQLDTRYERSQDPAQVHGLRDVQSAGLAIDAYGGFANAGLALFVDAHFGAGWQGGFAYRFALLPFGIALYDRHQTINLGIATGLQLQGVTDHQLLGVQMPVRAYARLRMGSHLLLDLWASDETSLGTHRNEGSPHALVGDELRAGLSFRIGGGGKLDESRNKVLYGNGYFVGVSYAERFQTKFWGLAIGHGMDMHGT